MYNTMSNVSFNGLPRTLYNTKVESINAKDLCAIIRDAGTKAGTFIRTAPKRVLSENAQLFNGSQQITPEGARLLQKEYGATTCTELRDALADGYKKYGNSDAILDRII